MSNLMDPKTCCHGRYSFRGFQRNLFIRMMNNFESLCFIAVIGEGHALFGKKVVTLILIGKTILPSYYKINHNQKTI